MSTGAGFVIQRDSTEFPAEVSRVTNVVQSAHYESSVGVRCDYGAGASSEKIPVNGFSIGPGVDV